MQSLVRKPRLSALALLLSLTAATLLLLPTPACADDCDRECSHCLLRNPFNGNCIQHGNDPTCEAAKKACQIQRSNPGVPIILAPVTGAITTVNQCVANLRECPQAVIDQVPQARLTETCLANIKECPNNVIKSIPTIAVAPIVQQYLTSLRSQASGRWQDLEDELQNAFSGSYPDIDLGRIRYSTKINTTHGQAITVCNQVFFPDNINLHLRSDKELMLHELEHSAQCARKGGQDPFLSEYILHSMGRIIERRSLDVHDHVNMEKDAIGKASELMNNYGWEFRVKNSCTNPVQVGIRYRDGETWRTRWYNFEPNESAWLYTGDVPIHSDNRVWYFYAEDKTDGGNVWSGDHNVTEDGQTYPFKEKKIAADAENFNLELTCS